MKGNSATMQECLMANQGGQEGFKSRYWWDWEDRDISSSVELLIITFHSTGEA